MRDKLKRQQSLGLQGKDLYSSYANLGEFMVHDNLWAMMGGDAVARDRVKEGREFIRKSIRVNPSAHFDLGGWQVVAVDSCIDAAENPLLVRQGDLIGNRINLQVSLPRVNSNKHYEFDGTPIQSRPFNRGWTVAIFYPMHGKDADDPKLTAEERIAVRSHVTQVGGEFHAKSEPGALRGKRAAFDVASLWLIGEWRQGSGPNPHYALCLGEIMLRVGQRYLAWNCYERASRMAEQFWPTPELQQFLPDHCKSRQTAIEQSLPANEVAGLRPKFESELAFGEQYQREYQDYEEGKIRAGANLNDEHFYDEFHATHEPIASKVGPEEWYAGTTDHSRNEAKLNAFWQWGLFSGGACVLVFAIVLNFLPRSKG
jgi:hypothetical protein